MADTEAWSDKGDNSDIDDDVINKTRVVSPLVNVAKEHLKSPSELEDGDGGSSGCMVKEDNDDLDGVPIDRGWAWMIVVASFGMHVLVVGAMKSFGVLFVEFRDKYNVSARELGTVQGITTTLMFSLGLGANILAVRFTSQKVVFAGGIFTALGFILSAYIPKLEFLYLTYSVITGVGFALSYSPCVVMVGRHFKRRRSLANGISVSGAGVGSFILPNLMRWMLNEYSLSGCLLLLGGLMLNVCCCAMLLRPVSSYRRTAKALDKKFHQSLKSDPDCQQLMEVNTDLVPEMNSNFYSINHNHRETTEHLHENSTSLLSSKSASNGDITVTTLENIPEEDIRSIAEDLQTKMKCSCCKRKSESSNDVNRPKLFDWSLLSNPLFLIYAFSCGIAHFAYPNIFFMLPAFAESNGQDRDSAALLLSIIGITDLVGRLFFGWFSDLSCVQTRYGFVGGLFISGVLTMLAPTMPSFSGMAAYAALFGFFGGSFFALLSVLLAEALGIEKLGSSYGLATLAMSIGLLPGPLICGEILDLTSKWDMAFVMCGVLTLIASVPPLFEPCARRYVDAKAKRKQENIHKDLDVQ